MFLLEDWESLFNHLSLKETEYRRRKKS